MEFMGQQAPLVQNMMASYLEQSRAMFAQMQDTMQTQARSVLGQFPFQPPRK